MSRDPAFTAKVKDVVGLYLNPPDNAIVLSIDEKTSIHALDPRGGGEDVAAQGRLAEAGVDSAE